MKTLLVERLAGASSALAGASSAGMSLLLAGTLSVSNAAAQATIEVIASCERDGIDVGLSRTGAGIADDGAIVFIANARAKPRRSVCAPRRRTSYCADAVVDAASARRSEPSRSCPQNS